MTKKDIEKRIQQDAQTVHDRIASAILESGRSYSWIAHHIGVARSTVAAWTKKGSSTIPDYRMIRRIAITLKVDTAYLLNATDINTVQFNDSGTDVRLSLRWKQERDRGLSCLFKASRGYDTACKVAMIFRRWQQGMNQQK